MIPTKLWHNARGVVRNLQFVVQVLDFRDGFYNLGFKIDRCNDIFNFVASVSKRDSRLSNFFTSYWGIKLSPQDSKSYLYVFLAAHVFLIKARDWVSPPPPSPSQPPHWLCCMVVAPWRWLADQWDWYRWSPVAGAWVPWRDCYLEKPWQVTRKACHGRY